MWVTIVMLANELKAQLLMPNDVMMTKEQATMF